MIKIKWFFNSNYLGSWCKNLIFFSRSFHSIIEFLLTGKLTSLRVSEKEEQAKPRSAPNQKHFKDDRRRNKVANIPQDTISISLLSSHERASRCSSIADLYWSELFPWPSYVRSRSKTSPKDITLLFSRLLNIFFFPPFLPLSLSIAIRLSSIEENIEDEWIKRRNEISTFWSLYFSFSAAQHCRGNISCELLYCYLFFSFLFFRYFIRNWDNFVFPKY